MIEKASKTRALDRKIAAAANDCRKAWHKIEWSPGDSVFAWHVHHERLVEPLIFPPMDRIEYILETKSRGELLRRLQQFRPVLHTEELPRDLTFIANSFAGLVKLLDKAQGVSGINLQRSYPFDTGLILELLRKKLDATIKSHKLTLESLEARELGKMSTWNSLTKTIL